MKKLIIAAFAVAFAAATQAASVAWGGYIANDARGDETAQAGTVFNAIFIGSNDYSAQLSTLIYDTTTGLVGTGTGANFKALAGQEILGTHTLTAGEAEAYQFMDIIIRAEQTVVSTATGLLPCMTRRLLIHSGLASTMLPVLRILLVQQI